MDFSYDYWICEVEVYRQGFRDPDTREEALGLLVRGICHLATHAARQYPQHHDEIMGVLHECVGQAQARMGEAWFFNNAQVVATHGYPDMPT
jgi:hypothetical protein